MSDTTKATTTKHTPTPWRGGPGAARFVAYHPVMIATPFPESELVAVVPLSQSSNANAEFIVRAVNAHEEILAVLRRVATDAETTGELATATVVAVVAAIRKAEGEE